jgi:outer membrane protein assembly factor BamE (lipoprotein component of BamABCDE complex)
LIFAAVPASLASLFGISGCSVAMALHGEETPDLRQLSIGSTRGDVEKMLGSPVRTVTIFHGVMDAVTLATWETSMSPQGS